VGKRGNKDPRAAIDPTLTTNLGFISTHDVTYSCSDAAPYYTFNGQLRDVRTGLSLSVNPGVAYINFTVADQGSISTRFDVVDDVLHWYNPQFFGGEAIFCVVGSDIFATFTSAGGPIGCVPVLLVLFRGQYSKSLIPVFGEQLC
jgi:hypothetical protein